jgi:hypothetical protein
MSLIFAKPRLYSPLRGRCDHSGLRRTGKHGKSKMAQRVEGEKCLALAALPTAFTGFEFAPCRQRIAQQ